MTNLANTIILTWLLQCGGNKSRLNIGRWWIFSQFSKKLYVLSQICSDTMVWVAYDSIKMPLSVKHCSFCFVFLVALFSFLLLLFFVFNFLKIQSRWMLLSMMFLQPLIWQQGGLAEPLKAFYLSNWFPLENFQQNTIFLSSTDVSSSLVYMT